MSEAGLLGQAPAMQAVYRAIGRLARSDATVLLTGQSGTGKERVARALHQHSARAERPFVAINMAAIPRDLMESELFGHERGAFTGAQTLRRGRFEQAEGGTLFLDEIGDMPAEMQTRLLRVLSEGHFYRVGGNQPVKSRVRVIAATHTDIIADRRVDQLSGGQQQRAFLAMTLAQETPYLLLDEPTTYLDLNHQVALMEMMAQQRDRGATVVAVLHDLNQAARYCDHLIVLKEGELMGEGSPKEVLTAEMLAKVFKVDAMQHVCPESGRPMVVVKDSGLTEQMVTLPDPGWKKEEAA